MSAFGAVYVSVLRADLNGEVAHDGAYARYSVVDSQGKDSADPRETQKVDKKGEKTPRWDVRDQRFDLLEPLSAVTKLRVKVRDKRTLFSDTNFGTAELSLCPPPKGEQQLRLKDGDGGTVTVEVRYEGPPPGGSGAAGVLSPETMAAAASGDPTARAAVAAASLGSAKIDISKLPDTQQGERVMLRIMPLVARNLVQPTVDVAGGEIAGQFRMVRIVVRQGTTAHMQSSRPVPSSVDGEDMRWGDGILIDIDSPGGKALWTLSADITVLACGAGGGDDGVPIGSFSLHISQIWVQKGNCLASQWLGLGLEGGGCTGFLQIDAALALGGATPEDPDPVGTELEQERRCLFSPYATRETVLLSVDLHRAEDLPEMDDAPLGKRIWDWVGDAVKGDPAKELLRAANRQDGGVGACDPFAVLSVGGQVVESGKLENTVCPIFNQKLVCPVKIPMLSRAIRIDLWDHDNIGPDDPCCTAFIPVSGLCVTVKEKHIDYDELDLGMDIALFSLDGLRGRNARGEYEDLETLCPFLWKARPPYLATVVPIPATEHATGWLQDFGGSLVSEGASQMQDDLVYVRFRHVRTAAEGGSGRPLQPIPIYKKWWTHGPSCDEKDSWPKHMAPKRRTVIRHLPLMPPRWINMYGRVPGDETVDSNEQLMSRDTQECYYRGRLLVGVGGVSAKSAPDPKAKGAYPLTQGQEIETASLARRLLALKGEAEQKAALKAAGVEDKLLKQLMAVKKERPAKLEIKLRALSQTVLETLAALPKLSTSHELSFQGALYTLEVRVQLCFGLPQGQWHFAAAFGPDMAITRKEVVSVDQGTACFHETFTIKSFWEQLPHHHHPDERGEDCVPDVLLYLLDEDRQPVAFHRLPSPKLSELSERHARLRGGTAHTDTDAQRGVAPPDGGEGPLPAAAAGRMAAGESLTEEAVCDGSPPSSPEQAADKRHAGRFPPLGMSPRRARRVAEAEKGWWSATLPMHTIGQPAKVQGLNTCWAVCSVRLQYERPESDKQRPGYTLTEGSVGVKQGGMLWVPRETAQDPAGDGERREYHSEVRTQAIDAGEYTEHGCRAHVYQGRGLPAADDNGRCDPYLRIIFPTKTTEDGTGGMRKTYAASETLNPQWNMVLGADDAAPDACRWSMLVPKKGAQGNEDPPANYPMMVIEVWDNNKISKDTLLGRTVLRHPHHHTGDDHGQDHGKDDDHDKDDASSGDEGEKLRARRRREHLLWRRMHAVPCTSELMRVANVRRVPSESKCDKRLDWVTVYSEHGQRAGEVLIGFDSIGDPPPKGHFGGQDTLDADLEKRQTKAGALDFGGNSVSVVPVPKVLCPTLIPYNLAVCVHGLRRMQLHCFFGLQHPSLRFSLLDRDARLVSGKGGERDLVGWVTDRRQRKKGSRVVWEVKLPEQTRHFPKLMVELMDTGLFGVASCIGEGTIDIARLARQLQEEEKQIGHPVTLPGRTRCPLALRPYKRAAAQRPREFGARPEEPDSEEKDDAAAEECAGRRLPPDPDPKRERYKDHTSVDERGRTPWYADYDDSRKAAAAHNHASCKVLIVGKPLEQWIREGMRRAVGDRFFELPLHPPGRGSAKQEIGHVRLRVELAAAPPEQPQSPKRVLVSPRSPGSAAPDGSALRALQLTARVYVVCCNDLVPKDGIPPGKNDPYLELMVGDSSGKPSYRIVDKDGKKPNTCDPQFFKCYELPVAMPQDWELKINVYDYDMIGFDDLIGTTTINLEDRWYSDWRQYVPWHTETRPLYKLTSGAKSGKSQGTIEMWVDLFDTNEAVRGLPRRLAIAPPPPEEYELRCVVWNVSGCKLDDTNLFGEKMTDLYVKAYLKHGEDGKCGEQDTETHYRSLNGEGNFNWRMKWSVTYLRHVNQIIAEQDGLLGLFESLFETSGDTGDPPVLAVELWDNDLLPFSDDYIGRVELDLSELPRRLSAAEAKRLPSSGASAGLSNLVGKLSAQKQEKGSEAGKTKPLNLFALDAASAMPQYLLQETPKMWFGCYNAPDPDKKKNQRQDEGCCAGCCGRSSRPRPPPKRAAAAAARPQPQGDVETGIRQQPAPSAAKRNEPYPGETTLAGDMEAHQTLLSDPEAAGGPPSPNRPASRPGHAAPPPSPGSKGAAPTKPRPKPKDKKDGQELVGLVQLSFSLVRRDQKDSKEHAAGNGRAEPNQNPKLPEPDRPASSFSPLLHPFKSCYYIIWHNLWMWVVGILLILLILFFCFILFQCAIKKKWLGSESC